MQRALAYVPVPIPVKVIFPLEVIQVAPAIVPVFDIPPALLSVIPCRVDKPATESVPLLPGPVMDNPAAALIVCPAVNAAVPFR